MIILNYNWIRGANIPVDGGIYSYVLLNKNNFKKIL